MWHRLSGMSMLGAGLIALGALGGTSAQASVLNEFSLVTFGDQQLNGDIHIHGKSLFAGNLTLQGGEFANSARNVQPGQPGVVVLGDLAITTNTQVNNGATIAYGGQLSGSRQSHLQADLLSVDQVAGYRQSLDALRSASAAYAAQASTADLVRARDQNSHGVIHINGVDASGTAYLNVYAADVFFGQSLTLSGALEGLNALVINVLDSGSVSVREGFDVNVGNGNGTPMHALTRSNDEGPQFLTWNFAQVVDLTLGSRSWLGNILAPDADLTISNNVWGSVAVNTVAGRGQLHAIGDLPAVAVPSPIAFAGGLMLLGGLVVRRRRA